MTPNISNMTAKAMQRIQPMSYVTNGDTVGRFFGVTKRGTAVVAWGDKRDDYATAEKLVAYLQNNQ